MSRVYFIKPIGMEGPIKIGCSFSPDNRRKTLATWSPFPLEIVAEIEGGVDLERRFHALFVETHQRREWFGWSNRIAKVIAAINDGTFDLATLPEPMTVSHLTYGKPSVVNANKVWTPHRRFQQAVIVRMHALRRAGMPHQDYRTVPSTIGCERDPQFDFSPAERHINALTARYAPHLKPIFFTGSAPRPTTEGIAA